MSQFIGYLYVGPLQIIKAVRLVKPAAGCRGQLFKMGFTLS